MEDISVVKLSDLTKLIEQVFGLKEEVNKLRQQHDLKAYSIQETAELLSLHYNSIRKLIVMNKLEAKYLKGESGKCIIPAWSIKEYLKK